jgi:hypothetical protein
LLYQYLGLRSSGSCEYLLMKDEFSVRYLAWLLLWYDSLSCSE